MPKAETIYDLLRALIEHTGWRSEEEHREYVNLLNRLEQMNTFGDVAAVITTKTKEQTGYVVSQNVRQLREDLLGERPRLAEGDDSTDGGGGW